MITFDWALALALTAALLAGCAREMDPVEAGESQEDVVVTLTTRVSLGNTSTKAVNGDGVKTFAVGDQIAVVYTNTSEATVKATSQALTSGDISNSGKSAQFTVTLTNPVDGTVRYVYPASMVNDSGNMTSLASQDGTLAGLQAFDYAEGSGEMTSTVLPSDVALENQLAVGKFTLKDYTGTTDLTGITSLKVFCDRRCYTVTSASSFADTIYVAMNPIADKAVSFKASDGTNTYWKMVPSATLEASNIYPVNVTMGYPGVLPGVFSVSATEQVHFSQGNLQYIGSASTPYWKFAENQLTYLGEANASSETNVDRDLFGWGTKTTPYQTSDNGVDYSWAEWGENVISNGGNAENVGWYTLPDAGWDYILSLNSEGRQGDRFVKATINGVCGLIIFPDGWAGDRPFASKNTKNVPFSSNSVTLPDWENNLEPYGAVFLPNAGRRSGVSVSVSSTSGYYWTSTPYHESNIYQASALNLSGSLLAFAYITRATGYSVRLVLASETISSLPTTINLSTVTNDTVIPDGYVVKGTLSVNKKISIAAGATVTLDGVSINAGGTFTTGNYAGITCLGDATIVLNGTNSVTGFYEDYPGIYVPVGSTLVIQGPGTLNASSNANKDGNSAGIGAGCLGIHCGSIEIQGGVINATGAGDGAGIGSSFQSTCEGITISGGTITATGSEGAPGIGSGNQGGVGDITITSDVIKVTATKGSDAPNSIGRGSYATCGTVTIDGIVCWDGSAYQNGGSSYLSQGTLIYYPELSVPMTMEALTGGTIVVSSPPQTNMQYSLNGGEKQAVTTDPINVSAGDKVAFYGNGTSISSYYHSNGTKTKITGGTADVKVYGNIMSLVNENNFITATQLQQFAFRELFNDNDHIMDVSALLLPATGLHTDCYRAMFYDCDGLTTAPELKAQTLTINCYWQMFSSCNNLTSVTCLATNIGTQSLYQWLSDINTTGTLYVDPSMTGATWNKPDNWTVKSVANKP